MKLRLHIISLALLLALGAACNKPSATGDNSVPNGDNAAAGSADSQQSASSSQPRVPETVTVPSGKVMTIRLSSAVGSKISQAGQSFGGSLVKAVEVNGEEAIPVGAKVSGEVVDAKPLGRFAGGALLQLRLNSVTIHGEETPVQTATFTQTIKGKGKRTGKWTTDGFEVNEEESLDGPQGPVVVQFSRKWTMQPDGKTVVIVMDIKGPNGSQTIKRTFVKK